MKIGFLFPGQGTQKVGMGKDIYDEYEAARKIYDLAKELTEIDVAKITFEGPEELLNETRFTQIRNFNNEFSYFRNIKEK